METCSRMILLDILSCFVLIDVSTMAYGEGEVCQPANSRPCTTKHTTYIDVLNACVFYHRYYDTSWRIAVDYCHTVGAILVEPNTEERSFAVAKYFRKERIYRYWIGLSYDAHYKKAFIWSEYGNVLSQNLYERLKGQEIKEYCVQSLIRGTVKWAIRECASDAPFICAIRSELMPTRPKISVNHENLTAVMFRPGSTLTVSCEAVLSHKGDLRVVYFSNDQSHFIGYQDENVIYNESLRMDNRRLCKRHGFISVTLTMNPDMDGKTLACVSYIDEAFQMCLKSDQFCDVVGTLNVLPGVLFGQSAMPWWIIEVALASLCFSLCLLPRLKTRLNGEDKTESSTSRPGDESKSLTSGEESGTGTSEDETS